MIAPSTNEKAPFRHEAFCLYAVGVIVTLLLYGLLQERIMTIPYGGERFKSSIFLVFLNRAMACIFAAIMLSANREPFRNRAPLWKYTVVSLSNVVASTCQYESLKYVSFPMQMLGKSFKMMPVMCWGICIMRKRYTCEDWLVAVGVTGGVVEFMLTGNIDANTNNGDSPWGIVMLLLFLVFDGLTSTMQEKLFRDHSASKYNQMLYVNLCSGLVAQVGVLSSGGLRKGLSFCFQHRAFAQDAVALSFTAIASQWFILSQVKEFGALAFAATMNCRQVVSILFSTWVFEHSLTSWQCLGLLTVFSSLLLKTHRGDRSDISAESQKLLSQEVRENRLSQDVRENKETLPP